MISRQQAEMTPYTIYGSVCTFAEILGGLVVLRRDIRYGVRGMVWAVVISILD